MDKRNKIQNLVDIDRLRSLSAELGCSESEHFVSLAKARLITQEHLKNALGILSQLAIQIAEEGLNRLQIQETGAELRKSKTKGGRQMAEHVELQKADAQREAEPRKRKQAERALRQGEEQFRTMMNAIPQLAAMADADGYIFWFNDRWYEYTGTTWEQMKGWGWQSVHDPKILPKVVERWKASISTGSSFEMEFPLRGADGRFRPFLTRITPVKDSKGNVIRWIGTNTDISERKEAEEDLKKTHHELEKGVMERTAKIRAANATIRKSEARFRALSDNIPNGFTYQIVHTEDGSSWFEHVGAGMKRLYGVSPESALADVQSVYALTHPDDADRLQKAGKKAARTLRVFNAEGRIITPSGEVRWIHWRSTPVRLKNGNTLSHGIATDITGRKKAEEALNRANRTLQVIKECDKALVRASSKPELLDGICRILMNLWGAKMAWVGFAENDPQRTVRVVADSGSDKGYLEKMHVTWADEPLGRGPVGTAIRTRQVSICRDISTNPSFAPWRELALERGYASMIALPLISDKQCIGALVLYSAQPDSFNDDEVELLTQLAGDVAYGIVSLRTRAERDQLQRALLAISEREKQHIARELHDGICQHLAGTAMTSKLLERQLTKKGAPEAKVAKQICELLSTGVEEARNLSHGLYPVKSEPTGLMDALKVMAGSVTKLFHVRCSFRCVAPVFIESETTATHLFRIAQEAVNNAMKHGQASRIFISLHYADDGIALLIRDNGIGIPEHICPTGIGMQIMKHRALAIGATMTTRRGRKGGTLVTCILPFAL